MRGTGVVVVVLVLRFVLVIVHVGLDIAHVYGGDPTRCESEDQGVKGRQSEGRRA